MRVWIKPNRGFYEALGLVKEWRARAVAARRYAMCEVAKAAEAEMKARLPVSGDYGNLGKAVKLFSVSGADSSYLLTLRAREQGNRDLDPNKTVVFVAPRKNSVTTVSPVVKLLENYSPWTLDTLPVAPKRREATVVYRRVSEKEVISARRAINRKKLKWEQELARAGVVLSRGSPVNLMSVRIVPDIVSASMNLEFGLKGESKPHWRPAILLVRRGQVLREFMKTARKAMVDRKYMGWKAWPAPVGASVSVSELKKYTKFQDRLGIL